MDTGKRLTQSAQQVLLEQVTECLSLLRDYDAECIRDILLDAVIREGGGESIKGL